MASTASATGIDVIVVGAGPVGLLLAIELKLGGAHVVVLERRGMGAQLAEAEDRGFAARGVSLSIANAFIARTRAAHELFSRARQARSFVTFPAARSS